MKIKAIKQRRRKNRVVIRFADDSEVELAAAVVLGAHLRVGDELTASDIERLHAEEIAFRCKESALHLLSFRPRARVELRRRLARKEYPPEIVEACLADLERGGLIDDESFARLAARDRLRSRPMGARQLEAELRAKGVDSEVAARASSEVIESTGEDEVSLARRASSKFRRKVGEESVATRRRLYAFLARRGFNPDAIRQVVEEASSEEG